MTIDQLYDKFSPREIEERINQIGNAVTLFQKYYLEKSDILLEFKPDVHIAIALKIFQAIS
jgi:hypothetical protein